MHPFLRALHLVCIVANAVALGLGTGGWQSAVFIGASAVILSMPRDDA